MATAYQNLTWTGEGLKSLEKGDYPTLKPWAYKLYIKWCKADPVSQTEIDRNEAVYKIQGNRNPFVDFPNLMEYIWGDSIDYAFDPATTVKSVKYNGSSGGGSVEPGETETVVYSANYHSADGSCVTTDIRYTGTTSVSATWEIQKATVTGKKTSSSIVAVSSSSQFDSTKPYEVFDMSGHRLSQNEYKHGVVIIRQGGKVFKMVKK